MRKLEIVALLLVVLVILGTPIVVFGYQSFLRASSPDEITVKARTAESGGWSPSSITVKAGQKVRLRITSEDVVHGIGIPELGIQENNIYPGKWVTVEFVASKSGTFPFYCTVLCSPKHGLMQGKLIVEGSGAAEPTPTPTATPTQIPPTPTSAGAETKPAPTPTPTSVGMVATPAPTSTPTPSSSGDSTAGASVYQRNCAACHGKEATGGFGPNLKQLAPTAATIKDVVRNGSKDKRMPPFGEAQISNADLNNLVAYLLSIGAAK